MLIIGAGGAGLIAALAAAQAGARVRILCAKALGQETNTAVSGGGFMMATDQFSVSDHIDMTHRAGHSLNDRHLVRILCEQANEARLWLEDQLDLSFNPKHNGQGYWFTRGGAGFFQQLSAAVQQTPAIQLCEHLKVVQLCVHDERCVGALALIPEGTLQPLVAGTIILASGGYAGLFARHDNPGNPVGEGIALALTAGACVRDMEFVQFYPLGLAEPTLPTFMAFRPFPPQARVIDQTGRSLTEIFLDTDDLNEAVGTHRDQFSRVIAAALERGSVRLDLTQVNWDELDRWFSLQFLSRYDFPWQTRPARIAPIAHHTMGGVVIDGWGQTTVPGLYAVGEAAAGVHGANRLGSNSLTECLVFGQRAGRHAAQSATSSLASPDLIFEDVSQPVTDPQVFALLQSVCWEHLGLTRSAKGVATALARLKELEGDGFKLQAACHIAQALAHFALKRTENRGAHSRSDFPSEDPKQATSLFAQSVDRKIAFVHHHT